MTTAPVTAVDQALERLNRQDAGTPAPDATLTIAEMAERAGVTAHTLRYYERAGLLDVGRDPAGHRVYDGRDYARVVFLTRLRMTGMPIRDLQRYIALVAQGEQTVPERLQMLLDHRDAVRAQLHELTFALETIEFKIAAYGGACEPRTATAPERESAE
jgi:DNA-binding transcriptional MerR regulator